MLTQTFGCATPALRPHPTVDATRHLRGSVRWRKVVLAVGVVGVIVLVIVLAATPGSVVTAKYASGEPANREALAALVGLLMLGFLALGFDLRDLF